VQQHLTGAGAMRARTGNGAAPAGAFEPGVGAFDALILWAMRQWMRAHQERCCATGHLLDTFEFSGLVPALAPLNRMMTLLTFASRREIAIATSATAPLSIDERVLLRVLDAARHSRHDLAAAQLGLWMEASSAAATARAALDLSAAVYRNSAQSPRSGRA